MAMRLKWWVIISIVIAGVSFFVLSNIVNNLWPDPQTVLARPQILFFTFTFLGLSAGTVPIAAFFNQRFAAAGWFERDGARVVREGAWVGLFGVILLYLQWLRALNWTITLVLGGVFVLIEIFFLTRE
jgi:hypothetical protein